MLLEGLEYAGSLEYIESFFLRFCGVGGSSFESAKLYLFDRMFDLFVVKLYDRHDNK